MFTYMYILEQKRKRKYQKLHIYQAGFNGGYGRGWSSAISVNRIVNITTLQASDRKGRFIYQINEESIIMGGCGNPDGMKVEMSTPFSMKDGLFT